MNHLRIPRFLAIAFTSRRLLALSQLSCMTVSFLAGVLAYFSPLHASSYACDKLRPGHDAYHSHFIIGQTVANGHRITKWSKGAQFWLSSSWDYNRVKREHFITKCSGFSFCRQGQVVVQAFHRNGRVKRPEIKHFLWSHGFSRMLAPSLNFKLRIMIPPILLGRSICCAGGGLKHRQIVGKYSIEVKQYIQLIERCLFWNLDPLFILKPGFKLVQNGNFDQQWWSGRIDLNTCRFRNFRAVRLFENVYMRLYSKESLSWHVVRHRDGEINQ